MAGDGLDGQLDMGRLPDKSNNLVYRMARKRHRSRKHHKRNKDGESSIPSRADTNREAAGSSRTLLTPVHPTASSSSLLLELEEPVSIQPPCTFRRVDTPVQ